MRKPTKMPEWLEKQFDSRTVATWSPGKREAAGIPIKRSRPIEYFTDLTSSHA